MNEMTKSIIDFLAMIHDFQGSDLSVDYETGRFINIANYANLTGYFVFLGIFFVFAFAIFLFIYDLKTASAARSNNNYYYWDFANNRYA